MKDENMRFGAYIKSKRLKDERELTLKDMSQVLGLSLSMLSDIEQGRRKPFGSDKIEKFCEYLQLIKHSCTIWPQKRPETSHLI